MCVRKTQRSLRIVSRPREFKNVKSRIICLCRSAGWLDYLLYAHGIIPKLQFLIRLFWVALTNNIVNMRKLSLLGCADSNFGIKVCTLCACSDQTAQLKCKFLRLTSAVERQCFYEIHALQTHCWADIFWSDYAEFSCMGV